MPAPTTAARPSRMIRLMVMSAPLPGDLLTRALANYIYLYENMAGRRRQKRAINPAFLGQGIFTEFSIRNALKRLSTYSSPTSANPPLAANIDRFVFAMKDMEVATVWIQLFTRSSTGDVDPSPSGALLRKDLIARLTASAITFPGWRYSAASN